MFKHKQNTTTVLKNNNTTVVCLLNTFVLNSDSMKLTYGDRLRLAREHKGLTQEQLVEISGVKQGTISKIERGDQNSSGFDAELAYALDIEAMWLKTGQEKFAPYWLNGSEKAVNKSINNLDEEAIDFALLWQELPPDQKAVLKITATAFIHSAQKQTDKVA